uniref:Uncharacterized protein n=3 Tax=Wuchereria bancrofti TaxID=6293 RepID=A0AAF5RXG6_WUCBA
MNANAPYASPFIVQQVCCACLALSIAYMQWYFRDACNTHILRAIVIINVCQFVQEIMYAYSTYMLIMIMRRKNDITYKFSLFDQAEVLHLLVGSFVIHGLRLITCAYPVAVFAKKAFPVEFLCRIRFAPNRTRGISLAQAKRADNADKRESNLLFYVAVVLSVLCIATDITYYMCNDAKRIGHTAISLIYTICLSVIYYHYRKERRTMFLKILAVLSIIIINSSIHTLYVFVEAMFTGRLYYVLNKNIGNFVINGSYFFLSLGLALLSFKSIIFCFQTIITHTPLYTQPVAIMRSLRWLITLAYVLIAVTALEILFTMTMYKLFSTRIDFILGTEFFLWINSISTCLLQIWVCKHERFQRCVIILIIQLISDCSTILLLIMVQAGIVQTVIAMMTRHSKTLQYASARIFYIVIDHILQIIQWALNICSLGIALMVLDKMGTEDETDNPAFDNENFHVPSMRELLTIEQSNSETNRTRCSVFDRSANIDYIWGESVISFDDNDNCDNRQDTNTNEHDSDMND